MSSNQGWECPKCGACYNPTTAQCFNCTGNSVTVASSWPAPIPQGPSYPSPNNIQVVSSTCPNCGNPSAAPPLSGCQPWNHLWYSSTGTAVAPSVTHSNPTPVAKTEVSWVAKQLQKKLDEGANIIKDDIPF